VERTLFESCAQRLIENAQSTSLHTYRRGICIITYIFIITHYTSIFSAHLTLVSRLARRSQHHLARLFLTCLPSCAIFESVRTVSDRVFNGGARDRVWICRWRDWFRSTYGLLDETAAPDPPRRPRMRVLEIRNRYGANDFRLGIFRSLLLRLQSLYASAAEVSLLAS